MKVILPPFFYFSFSFEVIINRIGPLILWVTFEDTLESNFNAIMQSFLFLYLLTALNTAALLMYSFTLCWLCRQLMLGIINYTILWSITLSSISFNHIFMQVLQVLKFSQFFPFHLKFFNTCPHTFSSAVIWHRSMISNGHCSEKHYVTCYMCQRLVEQAYDILPSPSSTLFS